MIGWNCDSWWIYTEGIKSTLSEYWYLMDKRIPMPDYVPNRAMIMNCLDTQHRHHYISTPAVLLFFIDVVFVFLYVAN